MSIKGPDGRRFRIVDAHCHIYPDGIARKAVRAVDRFYDGLPADPHDGTVKTLIGLGNASGIDHFVVHSVATTARQVPAINSFIAAEMRELPDRLTGLGSMHPEAEDPEKDLEAILKLGLHGVKLHPDIQQFRVDDPKAMRIFELCQAAALPVVVHTGDSRYDYSNPKSVASVLRAFPKLKFVGAHLGGWSVWEEAVRVLADFENLMVDTSSSFYWLSPERVREIIRTYGAERILFGTDYPMWDPRPEIGYLLGLLLSDEELMKILWNNAADLFSI